MEPRASISDAKLRETILQTLAETELTAKLNLRVGVLNKIVHLAGNTPDNKTRELAERLVAQIKGVRGVVNRIQAPGAPSPSRKITLKLQNIHKTTNEGDETI